MHRNLVADCIHAAVQLVVVTMSIKSACVQLVYMYGPAFNIGSLCWLCTLQTTAFFLPRGTRPFRQILSIQLTRRSRTSDDQALYTLLILTEAKGVAASVITLINAASHTASFFERVRVLHNISLHIVGSINKVTHLFITYTSSPFQDLKGPQSLKTLV